MGYVYFIKHNNISPIKIGHTNNDVMNRVNSFNTASPYGVELLGYIEIDNAVEVESEIHQELKDYRLNGEWFDIEIEMIEAIAKKYPVKDWERKRIACDIPYEFDYTEYNVNQLKIFRQFFYSFYINQVFDFELIKLCVKRAVNKEIDLEYAKSIFNKWNKIKLEK